MLNTKTSRWIAVIAGALLLIPTTQALAGTEARAPEVRVYSAGGNLDANFLAYSRLFGGGVAAAVGDISGDNQAEIVTASGEGGNMKDRFGCPGNFISFQMMIGNNYFYS